MRSRLPFGLQANNRANRGRAGSSSARAGVRHPRSIMHPQFKNFTHVEAEEYLKEVLCIEAETGARGKLGMMCMFPPKTHTHTYVFAFERRLYIYIRLTLSLDAKQQK